MVKIPDHKLPDLFRSEKDAGEEVVTGLEGGDHPDAAVPGMQRVEDHIDFLHLQRWKFQP